MTSSVALEYIKSRMYELGYGDNYIIRFRHLRLRPGEERQLEAHNQLCVLIDPCCDIKVESDAGLYDMSEEYVNEMQYEHRGSILVINFSALLPGHLRMIQAIPQNCERTCP